MSDAGEYTVLTIRLLSVIASFGTVGLLIALNVDLYRARRYLPTMPPPMNWWAVPVVSVKFVLMNAWLVYETIFDGPDPDLHGPLTWRPFALIAIGVIGIVGFRAINRAVDSWVAYVQDQRSVRRELRT